jgi:hypothetical protein
MPKFSKQLLEQMHDLNVRFKAILHIPTLCLSLDYNISDEFQEFLEAASEENQSTFLLSQCPDMASTLKEIRENDFITDFSKDVARDLFLEAGDFEFLIKTEVTDPQDFVFKENGEFETCGYGGWQTTQWILAKDMTQAAEIAVKEAQADWNQAMLKAKTEQGLVQA